MTSAHDLAGLPLWRASRRGRKTCGARVCHGPAARLITRVAGADGLVLGRRVFVAPGAWGLIRAGSPRALELLEHELVHVEQYRRLGFFGFLWRYSTEYFGGRWRGLGHWEAYRSISLEVEARSLAVQRTAWYTTREPPRRELPRQGARRRRSWKKPAKGTRGSRA